MKKHNSKVSIQNSALDSFLLLKIAPQQMTQLKGGGDDGSDDIIIIEDPVV